MPFWDRANLKDWDGAFHWLLVINALSRLRVLVLTLRRFSFGTAGFPPIVDAAEAFPLTAKYCAEAKPPVVIQCIELAKDEYVWIGWKEGTLGVA